MEQELEEIDRLLKRLEGKSGFGYESWRRSQAVQKQRDNKVLVYNLCLSHGDLT